VSATTLAATLTALFCGNWSIVVPGPRVLALVVFTAMASRGPVMGRGNEAGGGCVADITAPPGMRAHQTPAKP
jgi:hypothetical protein